MPAVAPLVLQLREVFCLQSCHLLKETWSCLRPVIAQETAPRGEDLCRRSRRCKTKLHNLKSHVLRVCLVLNCLSLEKAARLWGNANPMLITSVCRQQDPVLGELGWEQMQGSTLKYHLLKVWCLDGNRSSSLSLWRERKALSSGEEFH